ncbi:MAG: signal recognition particle-docking protein FtsY [Desulfurococcales archaeon]|nr:signal recognition particle-docking protein FtsY [Desulfurococcales archaeon]
MFKALKNVFSSIKSSIAKGISDAIGSIATKEIRYDDIIKISSDLVIKLVEADVAYEVAEEIVKGVAKKIDGTRIGRFEDIENFVEKKLRETIEEILMRGKWQGDMVSMARSKKPLKIVFMGVNGVGKTTTIAKVARYLSRNGLKVLVVAGDTFRAGAQEQLAIHCSRLGIPIFRGKYGSDPGAVVFDAIKHAERSGYDAVLIDTAGRQHTDRDLMEEIKKIVRVSKPDLRVLVLDSLTGNDAVNQAREFDKYVGVDVAILTKLDANATGGSAISIIASIGKPIAFIGVGQGYDDLRSYDPEEILSKIFSTSE